MDRLDVLQEKRIDAQIQRKKDDIYTVILMTLGIVAILMSTFDTVIEDFTMSPQTIGFLSVGITLFIGGAIWRHHNENKLKGIMEDYEDLGNIEEEGDRIKSVN